VLHSSLASLHSRLFKTQYTMAFAARQLLLLKLQDEGRQKASQPVPVCFPAGFGTTRRVAHVDIRMLQYSTCRDQMEGTAKERGCQEPYLLQQHYLLQNPTYCNNPTYCSNTPAGFICIARGREGAEGASDEGAVNAVYPLTPPPSRFSSWISPSSSS